MKNLIRIYLAEKLLLLIAYIAPNNEEGDYLKRYIALYAKSGLDKINKTNLTKRQIKLGQFATELHKGQVRKYTGEPYIQHCIKVAEKANSYGIEFGWEIGICHDLIEDTECDEILLLNKLNDIGYNSLEAFRISYAVYALTDRYIREDYPNYNRAKRKKMEAERLWSIPADAQSVKYCDLIDNTESICYHDAKFAKVYLGEKEYILKGMRSGNAELLNTCELKIKLNKQ